MTHNNVTPIKWIKWEGGDCPVDPGTTVTVRYRADTDDFDFERYRKFDASTVLWRHYPNSPQTDIVAYKICGDA